MVSSIRRIAIAAALATAPSVAVGEDLFEQHRRMMIRAIAEKNPAKVQALLRTPYVLLDGAASVTYLTHAISNESLQIVSLLIEAGAAVAASTDGPKFCSNSSISPLPCTKNLEIAKRLVDAGANLNEGRITFFWEKVGNTYLTRFDWTVDFHLKHGSLKDRQEPITGYSLLHKLIRDSQRDYSTDLIRLLDAGWDPNDRSGRDGLTPFILAINRADEIGLRYSEILFSRGADPMSKDKLGMDAMQHLEAPHWNSGICLYLNEETCNSDSPRAATCSIRSKIRKVLIQEYGYPDSQWPLPGRTSKSMQCAS